MFGIGLPETFVLLAIVLAVVFVPRMRAAGTESRQPAVPISGKTRLLIVLSGLWLLGSAAFTKPWSGTWGLFAYAGVGPVVLLWCALWVVSGLSSDRKAR
jgi:hypothetical protein